MDVKPYTRWLWMLAGLALPLMVLGILAAVAQVSVLARYDSTYFSESHVARYGTPGTAAKALEISVRRTD